LGLNYLTIKSSIYLLFTTFLKKLNCIFFFTIYFFFFSCISINSYYIAIILIIF